MKKVADMTEKGHCTKSGMTADRQAFKHSKLSRALRTDDNFGETTPDSLPLSGNENETHQPYCLKAEQWHRTIAEVARHNTYR
jgi:hypothetical protein